MSNEAQTYVATLKVGDTTRKFILLRLADRADERFSCFPSVPLLAAEAEVSERTIQRHLATLREMKLISDKERTRADGSTASSRFFLHGPWDSYGGTGVPFATITTPKQRRAEQWAEPPREGSFRPGTAAAEVISLNSNVSAGQEGVTPTTSPEHEKAADVNSNVSAGQQGVTPTSPPPVTPMSPHPVTPMSPLEPTEVTPTSEPTTAPSARSANDGRRPSTGSSARGRGGSAASGGAKAPGKSSSASKAKGSVRMSRAQAAAVKTVEDAFPAELAAVLPRYRPAVLRDAIVDALRGRTADQLAERIDRRWYTWGFAAKADGGDGLERPVGVAVRLVGDGDCADARCEDGVSVDTGAACPRCAERRQDRSHGRGGPHVPAQPGPGPARPRCADCEVPFAPTAVVPEDGVCAECRAEPEAVLARLRAELLV
ncbi:helix-turn-helix domain-containing protein [Streptomyces syringium]|uniref:helix-turn-helix domain-containing protein n=1 Tax=Streptomyces syringium TaxID=76729 RepID=UPI0037D8CFAD